MRRMLALLALTTLPAFAGTPQPAPAPAGDVAPPPPTVTDTGNDVPPPAATPGQPGQEQTGQPEPEVRIIQKGDNKIEEYRLNGKLYMVKVTPPVGAPYYLIDDSYNGPVPAVNPTQRIIMPRWILLNF